ncbi:MAG: hypothetical protein L0211_03885 [Planctomycetaceae bacterium]|nr:hypothetical protein [Planctomycetaceae bacterium]
MSLPTDTFDPYREWLGIEPHELPADHYRLLGLARFESDVAKIAAVADERMARVRSFQVGPRGRFTQRLLNELSTAKVCLLTPATKAAYDAALSHALSAALAPRQMHPPVPPVTPPPIAATAAADETPTYVEPEPAAPWWRIILAITAATLVVLVAALGWGVWRERSRSQNQPAINITTPVPALPEPEETSNQPTLQLQEGSGEITLAAATAQLHGSLALRHTGTSESIGNWATQDAAARWRFRLIQPGFFQVELKYATAGEAAGAEIDLLVGKERKACELRPSGGMEKFITDTVTVAIPSGGEHTFALTAKEPLGGDWLLVQSVRLIPVGGATPPAILPGQE